MIVSAAQRPEGRYPISRPTANPWFSKNITNKQLPFTIPSPAVSSPPLVDITNPLDPSTWNIGGFGFDQSTWNQFDFEALKGIDVAKYSVYLSNPGKLLDDILNARLGDVVSFKTVFPLRYTI